MYAATGGIKLMRPDNPRRGAWSPGIGLYAGALVLDVGEGTMYRVTADMGIGWYEIEVSDRDMDDYDDALTRD